MDFETDVKKFELDMHCPRCGHLVRAIPQTSPIYHISEYSDTHAYLVVRCPRHLCDLAFVIYDRLNRHVQKVFPYPDSEASDFHKSIPENIRKDFAEARKCWFADANKGVVVLCRRVLQLVAIDKGAKGDELADQINYLFSESLITRSLHDAANEIRYFGNFGAHPRDDSLDDISYDDVKTVMELTSKFLTDLYIQPFEINELKRKREEGNKKVKA